jgi:hypothetical protein
MPPQSEGHAQLLTLLETKSLAQVGKPLGISKQAVDRIAKGAKPPSQEVREGLAEHFGVPVRAWDVLPGVALDKPRPSAAIPTIPPPSAIPSAMPGRPSAPVDDDPDEPVTALEGLRAHVRKCIQRRKEAESADASGLALRDLVTAELRALAKWGQATGEMSPGDEARLTTSSRYLRIQSAIIAAILPYPDAYGAVLRALAEVEPEAARALEQSGIS